MYHFPVQPQFPHVPQELESKSGPTAETLAMMGIHKARVALDTIVAVGRIPKAKREPKMDAAIAAAADWLERYFDYSPRP